VRLSPPDTSATSGLCWRAKSWDITNVKSEEVSNLLCGYT
jgi:hypothetical protein